MLLRAHYEGAVPLDLLKEEQAELSTELNQIECQLAACQADAADVRQCFTGALDLLEDCHRLYSAAPAHLRKLLNQVSFDRVLVNPLVDEEGRVVLPDDRPSDEGDGGVDNASINPGPADSAAGDQLADQADGPESADSLPRLLAYVSSNASLRPPFE